MTVLISPGTEMLYDVHLVSMIARPPSATAPFRN